MELFPLQFSDKDLQQSFNEAMIPKNNLTKLTWLFVIIGCIVNAIIEAFLGASSLSTLGQLGLLSTTGLILIIWDRQKLYKPMCVMASWVLQNLFLVLAMLYDAPIDGAEIDSEEAASETFKSLVVRPLHWAVMILYVFTQGLTFKCAAFVILPIYCLEEVARSAYFAQLYDLNGLTLVPRYSVIFFVGLITFMCLYLRTLREMQLFLSNRNMVVCNKNMANLFDKLDEEGLFVYKLDDDLTDPKKQSKAASDENTQRISDDHIDWKRDLNAIDIKL